MRMILKISLSKKGENEVYNTTGITENQIFQEELWNFTNGNNFKPRTTQFKREGLHHFIIEKDGSLAT
jgi:hypothetical protein